MTEAEWMASADPLPMLEFLRGKATERKVRHFAVACCRRIEHLLTDKRSVAAVNAAQDFADNVIDSTVLFDAHLAAGVAVDVLKQATYPEDLINPEANFWAFEVGCDASAAAMAAERASSRFPIGMSQAEHEAAMLPPSRYRPGQDTAYGYAAQAVAHAGAPLRLDDILWRDTPERLTLKALESREQARMVAEVFGNPFRPNVLEPEWRTSSVVSLAKSMYDSRDFSTMPILSDALQDAGCENEDILNHCRSEGPHVRGCWVVDLILGKA